MFPPPEILLTYRVAVLLVVLSPGPDNILEIGRGLSQGRLTVTLLSIGAGLIFFAACLSILALQRSS